MPLERNLVQSMRSYKNRVGPVEWSKSSVGGSIITSLFVNEFNTRRHHRALVTPESAQVYIQNYTLLLQESTPFLQSGVGDAIIRSSLESYEQFRNSPPSPVRSEGLHITQSFWQENLPTIVHMADIAQSNEEDDKETRNCRLLFILGELITQGDPQVQQQARTMLRNRLIHYFDALKNVPPSYLPWSLVSAINLAFTSPSLEPEQSVVFEEINKLMDSDKKETAILGETCLRNVIHVDLKNGRNIVKKYYMTEFSNMGVEKPDIFFSHLLRGKSKNRMADYEEESQLFAQNYNVIRKLRKKKENSISLLRNTYNFSSFYRFSHNEDRLIAQCLDHEKALLSRDNKPRTLFVLSQWDNANRTFGDSKEFNAQLDSAEKVISQFQYMKIPSVLYEAATQDEFNNALRTLPEIYGPFASGVINAHGQTEFIKLGDGKNDVLHQSYFKSRTVKELLKKAFQPNALLVLNACLSFKFAQELSHMGFVVAGMLNIGPGVTEKDFHVNPNDPDTIEVQSTRQNSLALYENGRQVSRIRRGLGHKDLPRPSPNTALGKTTQETVTRILARGNLFSYTVPGYRVPGTRIPIQKPKEVQLEWEERLSFSSQIQANILEIVKCLEKKRPDIGGFKVRYNSSGTMKVTLVPPFPQLGSIVLRIEEADTSQAITEMKPLSQFTLYNTSDVEGIFESTFVPKAPEFKGNPSDLTNGEKKANDTRTIRGLGLLELNVSALEYLTQLTARIKTEIQQPNRRKRTYEK